MIVINKTISFSNDIQEEAISWILNEYTPLLQKCPSIHSANFFKIDTESDMDDCFALQIRFANELEYQKFKNTYEQDFSNILFLKYRQAIGIYVTVLKELFA